MHELSIVFYLLDMVEDIGRENMLKRVASVTLSLGEVSGVVPSYLQDAWRWAADKRELTCGAELLVEELPAVTVCNDCGKTYGTVEFGKTCPHCGSANTVLLHGNEVELKQLEGE